MNKKGIVFFYYLALGIAIIVLGIGLAYPTTQIINESMTNASCSTPADDWGQALCWFLDIIKPMYIGAVIFIGISIIAAKRWLG